MKPSITPIVVGAIVLVGAITARTQPIPDTGDFLVSQRVQKLWGITFRRIVWRCLACWGSARSRRFNTNDLPGRCRRRCAWIWPSERRCPLSM